MTTLRFTRDLHDFEIVSISAIRKNRIVNMTLFDIENDISVTATLTGVSQLYTSNFGMQNVILDSMIFDSESDSDYFYFCKKALGISDGFFKDNPRLSILYIEPSVGLELACIFESYIIE